MTGPVDIDFILSNQKTLLAELKSRQAIARDYVRGVAYQYATGLYLFGRPGTAKTHTVRSVLENEVRVPYVYQRGYITPLGLFELIRENGDAVIVLDDVGGIFRSDIALQVLLAALEPPKATSRARVVKYRRQGKEDRCDFTGGIICISNRELHSDELLAAFKSRVRTLNYDPSDAHLGALMLGLASLGWPLDSDLRTIDPDRAREVACHLMRELLRLGCRFDLRLLVDKALPDYQQWKDGATESDWRDLITASIEEHLSGARPCEPAAGREQTKLGEHEIVRQILGKHQSREARIREWVERTGKSERAFYRRFAEVH